MGEPIEFTPITGEDWGSVRLIANGRLDVTNFRDCPVEIGELAWQDPYVWGPGSFRFPQIEQWEEWETGDLWWLKPGTTLEVIHVDSDGDPVELMWKGIMHDPTSDADDTSESVDVACDGFIAGRLDARRWHGPTNDPRKDVGRHIFGFLRYCKIPVRPILGVDTGMKIKVRFGPSSMLELVDNLLTIAPRDDGEFLTIRADAQGHALIDYRDASDVAAKVFLGAPGVHLTAGRDLSREWTSGFGRTKSKNGELQRNIKHPFRMNGDPEPPPTDVLPMSLGDSGPWVELLKNRLVNLGILDGEDAYDEVNGVFQPGSFDNYNAATRDAVRRLQRRRGLAVNGQVDAATWNAMYDLKRRGRLNRKAYVEPLWELDETRKWNRTATGVPEEPNPEYDPKRMEVDYEEEVAIPKRVLARKMEIWGERIHANPPHAGTLTLKTDLLPADFAHGPTTADIISRLNIGAIVGRRVEVGGKNGGYQGGKTFHVAGASVNFADQTAQCDVDTMGRDLRDVIEVIEKRLENRGEKHSRKHVKRGRGIGDGHHKQTDEHAGRLADRRKLEGGRWNIINLDWGHSAWFRRVRLQVEASPREFAVAILNEPLTAAQARKWFGDPLAADNLRWANTGKAAALYDDDVLLWAAGNARQPCGYSPGHKIGEDREPTGDPLTGLLNVRGHHGHSFGNGRKNGRDGELWVAVWVSGDCRADAQRILWPAIPDNS